VDVFILPNMILTKLKGGLGNQLFQYSTGRYLAHKTGDTLQLDISSFKKTGSDTFRNFDLNKLNINAEISEKTLPFYLRLKRFLNHKFFRKFYQDHHPELLRKNEEKIKSGKNIYLEGYFQSEKNFSEIREILLKELTLKEEFQSQTFKEIKNEISNCNSVSIHIRRGDYIKNPSVTKYHGICDINYYQNAISEIKNKITNPVFYFFSDDSKWVAENFEMNEKMKIVSGKNLSAPEELFLMSFCKHNIIANSTFSWWSAWLNQNHDKIVIAPTPWIDALPNPHKNIIPETWIQIPKNH
jgi:hypothetical protein